jgi:hypothetical protein
MLGVLAVSISDEVQRIGAFLGIAAFIGLAALTLLYFAQARELRRLREWAGRAPERARELQTGTGKAGSGNGAPAPAPAPAPAQRGEETVALPAALAPSTVAGRSAVPTTAQETVEHSTLDTPEEPDEPDREPVPPPRRPAPAAVRRGPAPPPGPGSAEPTAEPDGRSPVSVALAVVGVLLVLVGAGFAATQLIGGTDPAATAGAPPPLDAEGEGPATDPSELAVHVLNGTTVSGLASEVADNLREAGYEEPVTGNNADQQRTRSEILFAEGHRTDAQILSEALDIPFVGPLDPTTTPAEGADVVVVVGADQAQ